MKKAYSVIIGDISNGAQYSLILVIHDIDEEGNRVNSNSTNVICSSIQEALDKASQIINS